MNKDNVLEFLANIFDGFWIHAFLLQDISDEISKSGSEMKFFNLLLVRLKYLREHGLSAVKHEEFEPLTNANGLYSMHLSSRGFNIRIIYAFAPDRSPILLAGFNERSGKRKTDYTQYIPIAQQRLSEELEAHKYEQ